jgi:hypothetical protein
MGNAFQQSIATLCIACSRATLIRAAKCSPLKPEDREWPWQYVHGTSLLTPEGKVVVYLVNDHLTESRKVIVQLPGNFAGHKLRRVTKDSVRLGVEVGTVRPTLSERSAVVEDLLTPMSLTAYLEEV